MDKKFNILCFLLGHKMCLYSSDKLHLCMRCELHYLEKEVRDGEYFAKSQNQVQEVKQ